MLSASSPVSAFLLLLLLLLLHYVLLVRPVRCFIFNSNSSAKAIWWWMLYRTLRKGTCTYEHEKKHVRCVGVYSGIMYGCVRYVLRVTRVDSGCTVFSFSKIKPQIRVLVYTYMFDRAFVIFSSFCFSAAAAAAAAAVGGAASFCTYTGDDVGRFPGCCRV